jgi:hypothetical protein
MQAESLTDQPSDWTAVAGNIWWNLDVSLQLRKAGSIVIRRIDVRFAEALIPRNEDQT